MIVLLGATGNIGSELLRLLAESGAAVRAVSRKPPRTSELTRVEWVEGDLANPESLVEIFDGAKKLFLVTGNAGNMVLLQKNAIAAAEEAGIEHVLKISALGASDHSKSVIGVWHYIIERALRESSLDWTILRPHVFMQNILDQAETIRTDGELCSPAGEASIPMIDTRDIAAVSASVLTEAGHEGEMYTLSGPEPVSYRRAAEVLSNVLGTPITYVPETEDDAWHRLREAGLPPWLIGAQLALASYQRAGGGTDIITDAVQTITGKPPRSFRDFARDSAPRLAAAQ